MKQCLKLTFFFTFFFSAVLFLLLVYVEEDIGSSFNFSQYFSQLDPSDEKVLQCIKVLFAHEGVARDKTNLSLSKSKKYLSWCNGVNLTSVIARISTFQPILQEYGKIGVSLHAEFKNTELTENSDLSAQQKFFGSQLIKHIKDAIFEKTPECPRADNSTPAECAILRDLSSARKAIDTEGGSYLGKLETCERTKAELLSKFENRSSSNETFKVPNIVHYIMFGKFQFQFMTYLSFVSVETHLKPEYIIIHGETLPDGIWWTQTLKTVKNIMFIKRKPPTEIFGKTITRIQHSSDIARYEIMLDYGGIYLDADVLILKSFDDLRKYDLTLGRETAYSIANGIIIAKKRSPFIQLWLETYHSYNPQEWGEHSVKVTHKLAEIYPHLVHVEQKSLMRPSWNEPKLMFENIYDWSQNYAMHVWKDHGPVPQNPQGIQKLNCTLGEVMRFIHYGNKTLFQ